MNFQPTDEERLLREAVAGIAGGFGHTYYLEQARTDGRTGALWSALAEGGFLGVNLPESHGGGGLGVAELAVVAEEIAAAGCPLLLLLVSPAICGTILARHGSDTQKDRWLPGLASGAEKMVFAITEPDAGSNAHRLRTRAVRDGDGWRLTGSKYYISGFDEAGAVLVIARVDGGDGRARLSPFIVDTDSPGVTAQPLPMGFPAPEKQYTLFFNDVKLDADRRIGGDAGGWRRSSTGSTPSASWPRRWPTGSPASPWAARPPTPGSGRSGASPSALTRASPTPWPRPMCRWRWPG